MTVAGTPTYLLSHANLVDVVYFEHARAGVTYVRSSIMYFACVCVEHLTLLLATCLPKIRAGPHTDSRDSRWYIYIVGAEEDAKLLRLRVPVAELADKEWRCFASEMLVDMHFHTGASKKALTMTSRHAVRVVVVSLGEQITVHIRTVDNSGR